MIKQIHGGRFQVQDKNKVHNVDFGISSGTPTCSCKDWESYRIPCKHFLATYLTGFRNGEGTNYHKAIKITLICL